MTTYFEKLAAALERIADALERIVAALEKIRVLESSAVKLKLTLGVPESQ